ncbi:hypothetical protein ES708_03775 [subsurface metagenome]
MKNSYIKSGLYLIFIVLFAYSSAKAQQFNWEWAKKADGTLNDRALSVTTDQGGNVYFAGWFESDSITFDTLTLYNNGMRNVYIAKYNSSGDPLWAKSASGTGYYVTNSITTDNFGNIYITGYFGFFGSSTITFGSTTLTRIGNDDIFIVKYDANGNVIWAKNEGGNGYDYGMDITTDADGDVYLTGYFRSGDIKLPTDTLYNSTAREDILMIKYDSAGNVIWGRSVGSANGYDFGYGLTVDTAKNIYITGFYYASDIVFASDTLFNQGNYDMFVIKYDQSGNEVWGKNAGGIDYDYGYDIASDTIGNIYITGEFQSSSISFDTITLSSKGAYVVKYNSAGNVLWAKETSGIDVGQSISNGLNNSVFVSGMFTSNSTSFGSITLNNMNSNGSSDIFLVKYNSNGNVIWAKGDGGTSSDENYGVSIDPLENIYSIGYFWNTSIQFDTITLTNSGGSDVYLSKIGFRIENTEYSHVSCSGSNDGTITIDAFGGSNPLQYSIDSGNTFYSNNAFSNLGAGYYPIIVSDSQDTLYGDTIEIFELNPTYSISDSAVTICSGDSALIY